MIYLNENILLGEYNSRYRKENMFEITEEKKVFIMEKRSMHGTEMKEYKAE